jgi:hypothetical protein
MLLKGTKIGAKYKCDERLKHLVGVKTTVQLSESEMNILYLSTKFIANHKNFKILRKRPVSLLITHTGSVTLTFPNKEVFGNQGSHIFINYASWKNLDDGYKLICLTEELVHHFWDTPNEAEVSKVVSELIPGIGFDPLTGKYLNP